MAPHSQRPRAQVRGPLLLAVGVVVLGMILGYVVGANLPVTSAKESPHVAWWVSVLTVIAFLIVYPGLVAALAWWTRSLQVDAPLYLRKAIRIGIVSGIFAIAVSWIAEDALPALGGWVGSEQGSDVVTGFIEEGTKILIPLVLIGTLAMRHVLTAFWAVFTSAATFGLVEGAMSYIGNIYEPNPPTPGFSSAWVQSINTLNISGEVHHILYTAPIAALIWFAAITLPKGKAWAVGVAAYLGASVIHAANDGVLAFYLDGSVYAIFIEVVVGIVLLLTWYYLPVRRLCPPVVTAETVVGGPSARL